MSSSVRSSGSIGTPLPTDRDSTPYSRRARRDWARRNSVRGGRVQAPAPMDEEAARRTLSHAAQPVAASSIQPADGCAAQTPQVRDLAFAHSLRVAQLVELPHAFRQCGDLEPQKMAQLRVAFGRRKHAFRRIPPSASPSEVTHEVDRLVSGDADDQSGAHRKIESGSPQRYSRLLNQVRKLRHGDAVLTCDAR